MIPDPKKAIVFDVDDTIMFTENRDYENSRPNTPLIEGMRALRDAGWHITLMSSRGMGRSGGDIASVEEQVLKEINDFCGKHDVPFNDIILGKPWAAYYVDDKAMTPGQFSAKYKDIVGG